MARVDGNLALEELYRTLMDRRFDFMPRGEHYIRRIYQAVKERHSELCDDSYLCSTSCKKGTNSPEWQHVVRDVLKNVRDRGGPVAKGNAHGFWLFGDANTATLTQEEVMEGRRLLKLHKVRERKPQVVSRKKKSVLKATGLLLCEPCGFDFAAVYGKLGEGFAECHHRLPLAEYDAEAPTLLHDLAIVCANCHRMLHRSRPMMTVEELRSLILQRRTARWAAETETGTSNSTAGGGLMADTHEPARASDPHNLNRFVQAQAGDPKQALGDYEQALREIRSGRKQSCWMWYIFPTFTGLWTSKMSTRYSIKSIAEARSYLAHPVLGPRLRAYPDNPIRL